MHIGPDLFDGHIASSMPKEKEGHQEYSLRFMIGKSYGRRLVDNSTWAMYYKNRLIVGFGE